MLLLSVFSIHLNLKITSKFKWVKNSKEQFSILMVKTKGVPVTIKIVQSNNYGLTFYTLPMNKEEGYCQQHVGPSVFVSGWYFGHC